MHPRERVQKIIDGSRQGINVCESWNERNPNEQPLDFEDLRVMLSLAIQAAKAWDDHDAEQFRMLANRITKHADEIAKSMAISG